MKERPILFSGAMVRALLDGSKTQTRRVMKPQPKPTPADYPGPAGHWWPSNIVQSMVHVEQELQNKSGGWERFANTICPYGRPGDRLWVRESWRGVVEISPPGAPIEHGVARYVPDQKHCRRVEYAATQARDGEPWRPSIHMPRWASRILLEIVSVRVERLQDISVDDCRAEGIDQCYGLGSKAEIIDLAIRMGKFKEDVLRYATLWEQINGAGSWDANPWVWVVEFKRVAP